MRKGDLVRVTWGGELNRESGLGVVLEYREGVLGGSWSQSYWDGKKRVNEFPSSPKRGQVLVLVGDDPGAWRVHPRSGCGLRQWTGKA